jgi:transcriptional regulator with XRE-family HTH domain
MLGPILRTHRKRRGYTIPQLAARLGTSTTYLWRLEHDQILPDDEDLALRPSGILRIQPGMLLAVIEYAREQKTQSPSQS